MEIVSWNKQQYKLIERIFQTFVGKNCLVDDPLYHYVFDLSFLKKTNGDYHVHAGDFDYLINVCGPLQDQNGPCDASTGVGACQTKPGDKNFAPVITGKLCQVGIFACFLGLFYVGHITIFPKSKQKVF